MKTYKIFLASSYDLKADRDAFERLVNRENKRLIEKNVFLDLEIWEAADGAMSRTRSQDEYNKLLISCDIFVMLYWTKVGKYTNEEFDLAWAQFLKEGQPKKIYVYKKSSSSLGSSRQADTDSLNAFDEKLRKLEQFPISYDSSSELEAKFSYDLRGLFDKGILQYGEIAKCLSAGQPAVPTGFIGRDDELREIRRCMDEGNTVMLINSEGGMGKTSIAAKYWNENLYKCTHNAWLFCEDGIIEEIKRLAPQLGINLKVLPEENHITVLCTALQNLPPDCLLVLDNANNPDDIKAFKKAFSGLHWHVLLTSRCQHVLEDKQEMLIKHLPPASAKSLFCSYYKEETPDFDNLLDRLLIAIGYNTLLIELFAKNMALLAKLGETLADLLNHLETKGLLLGDRSFQVVTPYTTHNHREAATIDDIIDALYDLTQLEESERSLLVNLALLPAESHLLTLLINLFLPSDKFSFLAQLSKLAQKGWLITDTKSYRLSPVVQKIIVAKNKPTLWDDAKDLVKRLSDLLYPEVDKTNVVAKSKWLKYTQPLLAQSHELNDPIYSEFLNNVASVLQDLGGSKNLNQAKELLEKSLQNYTDQFGEKDPFVAASQSNLAMVLFSYGLRKIRRQGQAGQGL